MSSDQNPDIRWKQRLRNFSAAFEQFSRAIGTSKKRPLTELEKQGLIQAFEFTHELAWNVMKDYFDYQGAAELISGSRDATREAFQKGLISEGEIWMEMIKSRNQTSHTYNQKIADEIVEKIISEYHLAFDQFSKKMLDLSKK